MSSGQDLQLCEILIQRGSVHLEQITEALELQKIRWGSSLIFPVR